MIELLVVISIIVLLSALSLKSIARSVANAKINKAMAEMTSLASTGASIYIDLKSRGYVQLAEYDLPDPLGYPADPQRFDITFPPTPTTLEDFDGFADLADFQAAWDGPYAVYQEGSVSTALIPGRPSGTTIWTDPDFPEGTPLDPWKRCYGLAWYETGKVMVIYSAGPDTIMQTDPGVIIAVGDDLLYKFR